MASESDTDEALLRRIRAGEQHALGEFFGRIASDSGRWCSDGWTGGCRGTLILLTRFRRLLAMPRGG